VSAVAEESLHVQVEAARVRGGLTITELWLRYVALGGNGDLFDVDAYLAGLSPLGCFDQRALAVAVNERLEESYRAARVPLPVSGETLRGAPALGDVVARLLGPRPPAGPAQADPGQPPEPPAASGDAG